MRGFGRRLAQEIFEGNYFDKWWFVLLVSVLLFAVSIFFVTMVISAIRK